jgi:hypothetical protein
MPRKQSVGNRITCELCGVDVVQGSEARHAARCDSRLQPHIPLSAWNADISHSSIYWMAACSRYVSLLVVNRLATRSLGLVALLHETGIDIQGRTKQDYHGVAPMRLAIARNLNRHPRSHETGLRRCRSHAPIHGTHLC